MPGRGAWGARATISATINRPLLACLAVLPAFAAAALAAPVAAAGSSSVTVGQPLRVTEDSTLARTNVSPVIIRDHQDPRTFYAVAAEMVKAECRFYVSHDAGQTWTQGTTPPLPTEYHCNPGSIHPAQYSLNLAQGPDGTLYYAMQPNAADGTHEVFLARSHDGGQSWQLSPVDIVPLAGTTTGPVPMDIGPRVAVDPSNPKNVYVSFRRTAAVPAGHTGKRVYARPWFASSSDGGATFTKATMISNDNVGDFGPSVVATNGAVYTFFPAQPEGSATSTPVYAAVSRDNGKNWSKSTITNAPYADPVSALYDASRKQFYAAWDDNRKGDLDAWFSKSADGVHWSDPQRLNDDPVGNKRGQYFPELALAPDGRVVADWYDFRNDPYPVPTPKPSASALDEGSNLGQWSDVYLTYSDDGGASWAANTRVTSFPIDRTKGVWNENYFFLSPPGLAAADDVALPLWSGTVLGNAATSAQDIFTAQVQFASTTAASGSFSGGPLPAWAWLVIGVGGGAAVGAGIALFLTGLRLRRRWQRQQPV